MLEPIFIVVAQLGNYFELNNHISKDFEIHKYETKWWMSSNFNQKKLSNSMSQEPLVSILPENIQIPISSFDSLHENLLQNAIVQAVSIGVATSIFLIMLLQTSKKGVFWLHLLSLCFLSIRAGLYLGYLYSPLGSISFAIGGVLLKDPMSGYRYSLSTDIFQLFLIISIQVSFSYQIYSILKDPNYRKLRLLLTMVFSTLGITIVAFQTYALVMNSRMIYQGLFNGKEIVLASWVVNVPIIMMCGSINLISLILIIKLVLAIRRRRYLGIKQFSGLHILLIGFLQTFLLPTILVIIDYKNSATDSNTILYTIAITLVVSTMPLATMWAKMINTQSTLKTSSLLFYTPSITSESDVDTFVGTEDKLMPRDILELINDDSFQEYKSHQVTQQV